MRSKIAHTEVENWKQYLESSKDFWCKLFLSESIMPDNITDASAPHTFQKIGRGGFETLEAADGILCGIHDEEIEELFGKEGAK